MEQDVDANEVGLLIPPRLVVERRVPPRPRLQLIEEVEHDLRERQHVVDLGTLGRQERHVDLLAAARFTEVEHGARGSRPA